MELLETDQIDLDCEPKQGRDFIDASPEEIDAVNKKVKEEMEKENKNKFEKIAYEKMQKIQNIQLQRRGWMRCIVHHQNKELDLWGHGEASNGEVRITVIYGWDPFFGIGSHIFPMLICKITFFSAESFKEITGGFEKQIEEQKNKPKPVEEDPIIIVKKLSSQIDKINHDYETIKMQYNEAKYHPLRNVVKQLLRKII